MANSAQSRGKRRSDTGLVSFESLLVEAGVIDDVGASAVALNNDMIDVPSVGIEQIDRLLQGSVALSAVQNKLLNAVYTDEKYSNAKYSSDLREEIRGYLKGFEIADNENELIEFIYLSLEMTLGEYSGHTKEKFDDSIARNPGIYASFFRDYENGMPFPAIVRQQLDALVPSLCAAVLQEAYYFKKQRKTDGLMTRLYQRHGVILSNAVAMGSKIQGEGILVEKLDKKSVSRIWKNRESFKALTENIAEGNTQLPERTEFFTMSQFLNVSSRAFVRPPVRLSTRFEHFEELPVNSDLMEGVKSPSKATLPEGVAFYNLVYLFRKVIALENGAKVSPFSMAYGFDRNIQNLLTKLALGEAALLRFDAKLASELFKDSLNEGYFFESPTRDNSASLFKYLKECISEPVGKVKPAESVYGNLVRSYGHLGFQSGPRALDIILKSMGFFDPATPSLLLEHMRALPKNDHYLKNEHARIMGDDARVHFLKNMALNPMANLFRSNIVPFVRVPEPKGIQGASAIDDSFHKTQKRIWETVQGIRTAPDSMEYQINLQVLTGYYLLGANVYDQLRQNGVQLFGARAVPCPDRNLPGLLPSLEGKEGWYREFFRGGRLPNSGRLVLGPKVDIPFGSVSVPPRTMAVLRGEILGKFLRKEINQIDNEVLVPRAVELYVYHTVLSGYSVDCKSCNLLSELRRRFSGLEEAIDKTYSGGKELLENHLRILRTKIPESLQNDFDYVVGEQENVDDPISYSSADFLQNLAWLVLSDPVIDDYLKGVNHGFPFIVSRFPHLHAQSFHSLRGVMGPPDDNTVRINPLQAKSLNADYDGDAIEIHGVVSLDPRFKAMLENLAPSNALFDAGRGSDLAFELDLNCLEGLIKGNYHFNQKGDDSNVDHIEPLYGADIKDVLTRIINDKAKLIEACGNNPMYLVSLYQEYIAGIRNILDEDDPMKVPMLNVINPDVHGATTTVYRAFLHHVCRLIGDDQEIDAAVGGFYLAPGTLAKTSTKRLEKILVSGALQSGIKDALPAVFQCFYALGVDAAIRISGSARANALVVSDQLEYVHDDPLVTKIRKTFEHRISALEMAHVHGHLDRDSLLSAQLRVEHGDNDVPEYRERFIRLRDLYLGSEPETRGESHDRLCGEIESQLKNPNAGLKLLLRHAVETSCHRYAFEYGSPHIITEQLLTAKIKAREELLQKCFMGSVNVIDGQVEPATLDNLVSSLSVSGQVTSSNPAMDRSVKAKTKVEEGGEQLKDLEAGMSIIRVGGNHRKGNIKSVSWEIVLHDHFVGEEALINGNLEMLSERLKMRKLTIGSKQASSEIEALSTDLNKQCMAVPFEPGKVKAMLKEIHHADPEARLLVATPLKDPGFPQSVSPDIVNCHPMVGVQLDKGEVSRKPLSEMRHRYLPLGAIVAGGIGEDSSQGAMKLRHVSGTTQEVYECMADYDKMKFGPFPNQSPYFRIGARGIRSRNPLSVEGLESYKNVFSHELTRHEGDSEYISLAREVTWVDGVEIFPGEEYYKRNGLLFVGTDRPYKMHYPLSVDNLFYSEGLVPVVPEKVSVLVDARTASALGAVLFEYRTGETVDFESIEGNGWRGTCLHYGGNFEICLPANNFGAFKKHLEDVGMEWLRKPRPAEGTEFHEAKPGFMGGVELVYQKVVNSAKFNKNADFIPEGAIIDRSTGMAVVSTEAMTRGKTEGFMQFLDYLKGRPLAPIKSVLAQNDCMVKNVLSVGDSGDTSIFNVHLVEGGKDATERVETIQVPRGQFPAVQCNQVLEAGDPLTFGYVALKDRSRIEGIDFRKQLADYLYAYHYSGSGSSMWSINTELLARFLTPEDPLNGKVKFLELGKAYQSGQDSRLINSRGAATRLGDLNHLIREAFLGTGVLSGDACLNFTPDELKKLDDVKLLIDPVYNMEQGLKHMPEELRNNGQLSVVERGAAIGIDV